MPLLDGTYAVNSAPEPVTANKEDPPRAIFLKLTPALLQHLKSLRGTQTDASKIGGIQLEVATSGAGKRPTVSLNRR
jgi:hypothetical protein